MKNTLEGIKSRMGVTEGFTTNLEEKYNGNHPIITAKKKKKIDENN